MAEARPTLDDLRAAVQLACRSQHVRRITAGRERVLAMPRPWVLEHVGSVATEALDLSDSWEYRRLLELAELLDPELVRRLVTRGRDGDDQDVREAAEEFAAKYAGPPV